MTSARSLTTNEKEDEVNKTKEDAIEVIEPEKGCWNTFSHCIGGMLLRIANELIDNDRFGQWLWLSWLSGRLQSGGPRFKSSHGRNFIMNIFTVEKTKI